MNELKAKLEKFSKARDATHCTPALIIAMQRATGGYSPLSDDRRGRVQQVLGLVDQIDMPRRFFVANVLQIQIAAGDGYSPETFLKMAAQVPHEIRLSVFTDEDLIHDPDLQNNGREYFAGHVTELFRRSDSSFFLKQKVPEFKRLPIQPSAKTRCPLL